MPQSTTLFGIFGGTFDPPHCGHLHATRQVSDLLALKPILFIPTFIPPHRPEPQATAAQRQRMLEIALADQPDFVCDTRELKRKPPSYTIDTLQSFRCQRPNDMPCLILGLDAALTLARWHRWQQLLDYAHVIVLHRPGWQLPAPLPPWWQCRLTERPLRELRKPAFLHLAIPPNPLSSSKLRQRIAAGDNVAADLPPGVWQYICAQRLYRAVD